MNIHLFDKIILKSGITAYVVEILGDGKCFVADIDYEDGTSTEFVYPDQIEQVVKYEVTNSV